jgi:signal transduction histidine kinase
MKSLRSKLLVWYSGSLIIVAVFFYLAVHIYAIKYSTELFILLLCVLGVIGFFIIDRMTRSILKLSDKMQHISRENLNLRVTDVRSNDEVGKLAISFNSLMDRLSEAFTREQQFIGDVAHELKTPLAIMKNTIQVTLSKERRSGEYRETLAGTLIDIGRLTDTVNDVLDLAWARSDKPNLLRGKVRISDLIKELEELTQKMSADKHLQVLSEIEDGLLVVGDRQKLFRAFFNLVDNAVRYTPKNGRVAITLAKERNKAMFEISNAGSGIPDNELPYVFDRYYRGSKQTKVFGSGLGLAISKSIIEAHRGTISISSTPGELTTVRVSLPHRSS